MEITDEFLYSDKGMSAMYKYEALWQSIDEYKGKPIVGAVKAILWNKIAEACCNGGWSVGCESA
jgi:hypothetical protein